MFQLSILTPEKLIYEGEAHSIIAPGGLGYLEILQNHTALVTTLKAGKITLTLPDRSKVVYMISEGVLEVMQNEVILLGDEITNASAQENQLTSL